MTLIGANYTAHCTIQRMNNGRSSRVVRKWYLNILHLFNQGLKRHNVMDTNCCNKLKKLNYSGAPIQSNRVQRQTHAKRKKKENKTNKRKRIKQKLTSFFCLCGTVSQWQSCGLTRKHTNNRVFDIYELVLGKSMLAFSNRLSAFCVTMNRVCSQCLSAHRCQWNERNNLRCCFKVPRDPFKVLILEFHRSISGMFDPAR